ncbi:MAG: TerC family protein [Nannocystaceae bacterium]
MLESTGSPLAWGIFTLIILFLLALDLGVFHRKAHRVGMREALYWSIFWVTLSLCFNGYIWHSLGQDKAVEFLNAYIIEKALSVDNIFVFIVIFRYMKVAQAHLHRVLFAGILGALLLRALFIFTGLTIVQTFEWTLYIFGAFLIYTGLRLLLVGEDDDDTTTDNWVKKQSERWLRVTDKFEGPKFFVRQGGQLFATSLFVTLLMIETADVVFALDSIPAIFGISTDPYIVFTSNVCAIMGLRAMFFLLENVIDKFSYLNYGLGLILSFVGAKMVLELGLGSWLEPVHVEPEWSLAVIGALLVGSMLLSLLLPPKVDAENDADEQPTAGEQPEDGEQPAGELEKPGAIQADDPS